MKLTKLFTIVLLAAAALFAATPGSAPLDGLWAGKLKVDTFEVPFHVQFAGAGGAFKAWFFNGDEKIVSTSGIASPGKVTANFAQYNSRLEGTIANSLFDGSYTRDGKVYPVYAVPFRPPPAPSGTVPDIGGAWVVENGNDKGEKAWHLVLRQKGADVTGAILRVDGDTGALTGRYEDGHFTMSHFSGARPSLFVLTPRKDGGLDVLQNGKRQMMAVRSEVAREKGLPAPDDPTEHIRLRDPNVPLRWSFPDLNGKMVSNTDPRFKGKVVIVTIGGSWCPNCHDEAPLLEDLYRKYKNQGLEIVELSFEEEDQLKNPTRLRAFLKDYGIDYTVLLAGEPSQAAEKLPQAINLDTFPASFFIGRDGLAKSIHAGFAGKATGALHDQLVEEINTTLARMLAQK